MPERKRDCLCCGASFICKRSDAKYCSAACRGAAKYSTGRVSTETQYAAISGNWGKYFQRLASLQGRKASGIDVDFLLCLLQKQQGLCALSGTPMTCTLTRGETNVTNASIDRIAHGAGYTRDNVRLVCRAANTMRWQMSDEELLNWCERIIHHARTP